MASFSILSLADAPLVAMAITSTIRRSIRPQWYEQWAFAHYQDLMAGQSFSLNHQLPTKDGLTPRSPVGRT